MRKFLIGGLFAILVSFVSYGQTINTIDSANDTFTTEFSMSAAAPQGQPTQWDEPYSFAIRTNLLHWLGGAMNLGVEWRATESIGIKVDGGFSSWEFKDGYRQHKTAYINPEIRWYLWSAKRFYVGAAGTFGSVTVKPKAVGYDGSVSSYGVSLGYQTYLSDSFLIDFNFGMGYISLKYDTFTTNNGRETVTSRDNEKSTFLPNQAGVSLVWKL